MKKNIIIICTFINIIATVVALLYFSGLDPTKTGPIGDTIGGIFSPIVGLISIYFIYKTFNAQRKQLRDQIDSNTFSKDTTYFTEGIKLLETINLTHDNIHWRVFLEWKSGTNALVAFAEEMRKDNQNIQLYDNVGVLRVLNAQLERMIVLANISNKIADSSIKYLFIDKVIFNIGDRLLEIINCFNTTKDYLSQVKEGYKDIKFYTQIFLNQLEEYERNMIKLNKTGLFIEEATSFGVVDFLQPDEASIRNRLDMLKETKGWQVK